MRITSLITGIRRFFDLQGATGPDPHPSPASQPDIMQLYRLAGGRDSVDPAIGALLARCVQDQGMPSSSRTGRSGVSE
ncbi:hypothetical protein [Massilia niastensis]|uniref:hypothetical protein n=1 Tax=Massilia niastensis TaxID=544911 RepID=UPI0012EC3B18|nr:hypothetical protein [Massilia niastensis]